MKRFYTDSFCAGAGFGCQTDGSDTRRGCRRLLRCSVKHNESKIVNEDKGEKRENVTANERYRVKRKKENREEENMCESAWVWCVVRVLERCVGW